MPWTPLPADAGEFVLEDAPAPLFRDPVYDGAADPSMLWDREREQWWLCYTQRRATLDVPGVAWVHGTEIGVATSPDGRRFLYRGTLDLDVEPGHNTYWAPEIFHHDGTYHLFVSYLPGVPRTWEGPRSIVHATSPDLQDWTVKQRLSLSSQKVIDPDVHRLPDGTWRLWYKDEVGGATINVADSDALETWTPDENLTIDDGGQEAPIVFEWRDYYWLMTDPHDPQTGLRVYRSPDAEEWTRQPYNLLEEAGVRPGDDYQGGHPDVFVVDDTPYLLYHVHQSGAENRYILKDGRARQTALQVAPLDIDEERGGNGDATDGPWLSCDRDAYHDPE
jgi:hypothetical protein